MVRGFDSAWPAGEQEAWRLGYGAALAAQPVQQPAAVAGKKPVAHALMLSDTVARIWFGNQESADRWSIANGLDPTALTPLYTAPVPGAGVMTLDQIMDEAAKHKRVLVPLHVTRAMQEIMDDEGWQWADVLGAAECITDEQYAEIQSVPAAGVRGDTITLTGHQLRISLDFINPDGPGDDLQMDDDLTFGVRQHQDDDGKISTGMCCWNGDTDGVLPLDGEYEEASAQPDSGRDAALIPRYKIRIWGADGKPSSSAPHFEPDAAGPVCKWEEVSATLAAHPAPSSDAKPLAYLVYGIGAGKHYVKTAKLIKDDDWKTDDDGLGEYWAGNELLILAAYPANGAKAGVLPEGWRIVPKKTCYALVEGNSVIASLAGPDAEENAAIIARILAATKKGA